MNWKPKRLPRTLLWDTKTFEFKLMFDPGYLLMGVLWRVDKPTRLTNYRHFTRIYICPFPTLVIHIAWVVIDDDGEEDW